MLCFCGDVADRELEAFVFHSPPIHPPTPLSTNLCYSPPLRKKKVVLLCFLSLYGGVRRWRRTAQESSMSLFGVYGRLWAARVEFLATGAIFSSLLFSFFFACGKGWDGTL
jgi:hypothetical protein